MNLNNRYHGANARTNANRIAGQVRTIRGGITRGRPLKCFGCDAILGYLVPHKREGYAFSPLPNFGSFIKGRPHCRACKGD